MKRTFIASKIVPGEKLLKTYTKLRNELKNEKMNWVNSDQFHITLFFLGDTEEEQIPLVRDHLRNIAHQFNVFNMKLSGLGVFKNIRKPRVLWAGIQEYETMKHIKEKIDREMLNLDFSTEKREFKPHLTLARLKWINDKERLKNLLDEYGNEDFQEVKIDQIIYYQSILKQSGPVYKPIEKFFFSGSGE